MGSLRKIARNVAKVRMKKAGMTQFCTHGKRYGYNGISHFSRYWKDYVNYKKEA